MACTLHVLLSGCIDYVRIERGQSVNDSIQFPPVIDAKYLSPHPSRLDKPISVGKNCGGEIFKVPPIEDRNKKDRLYYLWFLDNKLAWQQSVIEPDARENAVITLTINEQFLLSHFKTKIPDDFFERPHVIDFFVSDVEYRIPESRLPFDTSKTNEKEYSDYAYWIVSFSNGPC